jgi:hypothetical protein
MNILVLNAGSASLKFEVIAAAPNEDVLEDYERGGHARDRRMEVDVSDQPLRLKYWMARSCFSAAARVSNVPRFLRLPVLASTLREYRRYLPDFNFLIISFHLGASWFRKVSIKSAGWSKDSD